MHLKVVLGKRVYCLILYQSHHDWTTINLYRTSGSCIGYTYICHAAIGPALEQSTDWSLGIVHVMLGLSLAVAIGVRCDQGMISTCTPKGELTQCNHFGTVHTLTTGT